MTRVDKPNLLNRVLNDESWLTGFDGGRGVPTEISSANQTHHNKKNKNRGCTPYTYIVRTEIARVIACLIHHDA